jgi:hypothetical protein
LTHVSLIFDAVQTIDVGSLDARSVSAHDENSGLRLRAAVLEIEKKPACIDPLI